MSLISKIFAEMIGTFTMIFVGGGSILLVERNMIPAVCIPLAWGVVIALMILAMGSISGAHFNPAVTLMFALSKRLPMSLVPVYWGSQCLGGLAAVGLLGALQKI